jgi:hypothetical protein
MIGTIVIILQSFIIQTNQSEVWDDGLLLIHFYDKLMRKKVLEPPDDRKSLCSIAKAFPVYGYSVYTGIGINL